MKDDTSDRGDRESFAAAADRNVTTGLPLATQGSRIPLHLKPVQVRILRRESFLPHRIPGCVAA